MTKADILLLGISSTVWVITFAITYIKTSKKQSK